MQKRWIVLFVGMCSMCLASMPSTVFAISSIDQDCNQFSSTSPNGFAKRVKEKFAENKKDLLFFTTKDLKTTVTHLQQYCCDDKKSSEDDCEDDGGDNYYPSSLLLVDHLMDVGFRKLDGVENHCNILGISCDNNQTVPNLSITWREKITEIAEDREGYPPIVIQERFEKYRGNYQTNLAALKSARKGEGLSVDTLFGQYIFLCTEISDIQTWMVDKPGKDITGDAKGPGPTCVRMAQERYHQERQYVRTLMVEKAITYYTQNLESYLLDYYLDNRFSDLVDKYIGLEGCFTSVLGYTTNTACCNE